MFTARYGLGLFVKFRILSVLKCLSLHHEVGYNEWGDLSQSDKSKSQNACQSQSSYFVTHKQKNSCTSP